MTPTEKEHANDIKIAVLQTTNEHIHETLNRIEKRLEKIDEKIEKFDSRIWQLIFWIIGGFSSILLLIAHSFKWI